MGLKANAKQDFLSTPLRATKKCNAFLAVVQPDKIQPIIDFTAQKTVS